LPRRTLLLIDDHTLFRVGWGLLVRDQLPEVGLQEAVDLEDEGPPGVPGAPGVPGGGGPWPDLIALDVSGHGAEAVERLRRCRARWPRVPVLVLVDRDAPTVLPLLLGEGIDGVAARTAQPAAIAQLLRVLLDQRLTCEHVGLPTAGSIHWRALAPEPPLTTPLTTGAAGWGSTAPDRPITLLTGLHAAVRTDLLQLGLSPRQIDVLRLLAAGMSNKQIGRELGVAESTIKTHVLGLFQKLGVMSRTEAMLWAGERGLGGPMPPAGSAAGDRLRG
jgi:DNA-binding NarL/FixJ family response regulator